MLTPNEKAEIREFMAKPIWARWKNAIHGLRPSAFCDGAGSQRRDEFSDGRANARLGEIRGWELCLGALEASVNEPVNTREQPVESYPDAGRMDTSTVDVIPKQPKRGRPKKTL